MPYFLGPRVITDNLILYIDQANTFSYIGTGFIFNDISGNGYKGSLNVNVGITSLNKLGIWSFNGTNSFGTSINNFINTTSNGSYTINSWVYLNSLNTSCVFNSWADGGGGGDSGARIQYTFSSGILVSGFTTFNNGSTANNLLIVTVACGPGGGGNVVPSSVTDDKSNTWTLLSGQSIFNGIKFLNTYTYYYWGSTGNIKTVSINGISGSLNWTAIMSEYNVTNSALGVILGGQTSATPGGLGTGTISTTIVSSSALLYSWGGFIAATGGPSTPSLPLPNSNFTVNNLQTNVPTSSATVDKFQPATGLTTISYTMDSGVNGEMAFGFAQFAANISSSSINFGLVQKLGNVFSRTSGEDVKINNASINISSWANVCVTYSGTIASVYINGNFISSYSPITISATTGISSFAIGCNGISTLLELFNGNLGPLMVYNTSLAQSQVLQNFNATRSRFGL